MICYSYNPVSQMHAFIRSLTDIYIMYTATGLSW